MSKMLCPEQRRTWADAGTSIAHEGRSIDVSDTIDSSDNSNSTSSKAGEALVAWAADQEHEPTITVVVS